MAKRAAVTATALKNGTIIDVDIARTAKAKDIHAVIDRVPREHHPSVAR